MVTDSLFDDISKLLGGSEEATNDTPTTSDEPVEHAEYLHPFMQVDENGVPTLIDHMFREYFSQDYLEAMHEEGQRVYVQLIRALEEGPEHGSVPYSALQGEYPITKMLTGQEHVDKFDGARWITRLLMGAALLATISMKKGTFPGQEGQFAGSLEYRMAMSAQNILDVAKALSAPLRAEYMLAEELNTDA